MKIFNLKALVAFLLVLQVALVGPVSGQQHTSAAGNTVTENIIHQYSSNTWAFSKLVYGPNGDLYLSLKKSSTEIAIKKWQNGSWQDVTTIGTNASGDTSFGDSPDIAIDANNNIHVAFLYYKGTGIPSERGVEYGVYKNGSWSFSKVEGYSDPNGWKNSSNPSIAVDTNGKAHIVYEYNDANGARKYEIHYATNQSGTWTIKTIVNGTSAIDEVHDPQIEVDQGNGIHIAYVKEDNQNDYYGNYYYTHKNSNDGAFPTAEKLVDSVTDSKYYWYTPFVVDSAGKVTFSYSDDTKTYLKTNQSGTWQQEVVYSDASNIAYPIKASIIGSKAVLLMVKESAALGPSGIGYFAMVKEGGIWTTGTKVVSPSLVNKYPSEMTYAVDANLNFMVVMEDNDLQKVSYLSGTSTDFGINQAPPKSANADLSNLTLSAGVLSPGFASGTTTYSASVGSTVPSIQVTPTVADSKATVKVNGNTVVSGNSAFVPLNVGSNTITTTVTAEDGTTKTYTVTVTRAAPSTNADLSGLSLSSGTLSPGFASGTTSYTASVGNAIPTIQVTPTVADSKATVKVNGIAVTSGNSATIPLNVGSNTITIVVTAENSTTKTYTVTVTRAASSNADLSNLTLSSGMLSPGFASGTTSYTAFVGNDTETIQVTPTVADSTATVTVNGITVTSGNLTSIPLSVGSNLIGVTVTAQDGTTKSYLVIVTRVASSNADLSNLKISQGTLSPVFSTGTLNYTAKVGNTVATIGVTPIVADATATVKVNGTTVVSGNPIQIQLSVGNNPITVVVTAQNGTTSTYTVNVNRNRPPTVVDNTFAVDENSPTATSVGTLPATDLDGDSLSYSILSGNTNGVFSLNPTNGQIMVANGSLLDYETTRSYTLTILVSDGVDITIVNVTINVNDLNDNIPVPQGFTKAIDENTANGTSVGSVTATDADAGTTFTYMITGGNAAGGFAINPTSGEITVADWTKLDYETVKSFTLTVQVSDGTHTANTTVTINLINLNDNIPVMQNAIFNVNENAANGTYIGTVFGTDADGDLLRYQILSGNESGAFTIDAFTGKITVADGSQLDYEKITSYQLKVQALDQPLLLGLAPFSLMTALFAYNAMETDIGTITININDLNDNSPAPQGFTKAIDENTANGTSVGFVTATDADAGTTFTYKITGGNAAGAFAINQNSGEITVADTTKLDYETVKSFTLTVQVSDGENTADTTVIINLNNLNDNPPTVKGAVFNVDENAANGTFVGTVIGSDSDGDPLSFKILTGNESGAFKIDALTGDITVADGSQLDYETKTFYELTVQVSDHPILLSPYSRIAALFATNTIESDIATITINVNDLNDNPPVPQGFTKAIDENTANGTSVGLVTATDADAGTTFTYQITGGNEEGAFAINPNSGNITVADTTKLDYETVKGFTLTVQVSDGQHTADTTVTINLKNLNDNAPIAYAAVFSVEENSANGTAVGTVTASDADGDPLSYSIIVGNEKGAFSIDPATGKITVADSTKLDYETIKGFPLIVQVSDGKYTAVTAVTITLINLNDNAPVAEAAGFSLEENAANGTVVGTVKASDADGDALSYQIVSGNGKGAFTIDSATGKITVADSTKLDYETVISFTLTVRVSDGTHLTDTTVTINLVNLNDNAPVAEAATFTIEENAANGTVVGMVTASDADGDALSYKIISGNNKGAFAIDAATGKITVADGAKLDYETVKDFTLTVQVSDGTHTVDTTVTINLTNLNDNAPVADAATFTIDENAANGTAVGTVTASDADGDTLSFSIVSGDEIGAFKINAATGKITVADGAKLDYETVKSFMLRVQVSDGTHTADTTVTINLTNLNDNAPVADAATFTLEENAANGTAVGTITASDADGDALNYAILSGNEAGAFAIAAATGKITVADSTKLDYETVKAFTLTVQVSDGTHTADTTVTINLTNLNDNAPVGEDATFTIDEKAANGTAVGTVMASDADGDAVTYEISAGNDDGIFTIHETTGEITIADTSKLKAATKAVHTLSIRANDGQHKTTLKVTVNVLSSDVTLSSLTSSKGDLNPAFKPGTTHYTITVGEGIHAINLTPTTTEANATVKINGKLVPSGQESDSLKLDIGENIFTIEVTAQNGDTSTYTVTVTRLQSVVPVVPVNNGGTATVSDEQVNLLDDNGTLVVELKKNLDEVTTLKFTAKQLETLINQHAMIKVVKGDVQLLIPAINFTGGDDLTISFDRVAKSHDKLPYSNLALGAVYEFTIKLGDRIIHHFDHEIELSFPTDGFSHPKDLKVFYWNPDKKKWELVGGTFENGQIKASTNHFSTYGVFYPNDLVEKSNLPNTATNMFNWLVAGILVILFGAATVVVQRLRNKEENI